MKEIGSEFWDVPQSMDNIDSRIFPKSTQWFLSGRSALQAIINELRGCHTVAMPSWCCDSMVKPFVDADIGVQFYPVYWEKHKLIQKLSYDCDALFLMDYFGYTTESSKLDHYQGVVIRDVTHSIFSTSYSDADYYFGSLRKWCGIWTGGYAWTRNCHKIGVENSDDDSGYVALRETAMKLKQEYVYGVDDADKSYLAVFNKAEEMLETVGAFQAASRDIQAAMKLDTKFIRTRHRKNAEILRKAFHDCLIFREMKDTDCPMFVPILVPAGKRNGLRQHLINNEIYCPVHWPMSEYHTNDGDTVYKRSIDKRAEYIYANELSLVCDQRYTEEDMNRMVDTIKEFMKEA